MATLGTRVAKNADKLVRKVAMAVDQAVVLQTPVDTGRARANWLASLDAPSADLVEASDRSGSAAIRQAAAVSAGYSGDRNVAIHITNNLPYIESLNRGSSYQAPAGFVRLAVLRGARAVNGVKVLEG